MLVKLGDWWDNRTGFRKVVEVLLIEHIPGGAKWRYVWGSCLAFVFTVQLVTGVLLMTSYSPGDSTAWASVYFIQYQMDFGWLIRGLHHFGSQTMVVLLGVHMLQVVIAGAHLPPREVNWWLGLLLLAAVLGLSLTGYLLPWDQKGYWATQVATNIAGNLPGAGSFVQKVAVGGPVYGHHTLTRFYTMHVALLPPLVIILIILHLVVFRRHGVTTPRRAQGEGYFWPEQAFRDMLVSLLVFGIMLALVLFGFGHKVEPSSPDRAAAAGFYEKVAHAGQAGKGANLDAPADPSRPYPARPEWYFLFLFQLLKYFEGKQEIIGTVVIPAGVLFLLFLLPLLGYGRIRPFGHVVGILVVVALLSGAAGLTFQAIRADRAPNLTEEEWKKLPQAERQQVDKARKLQSELREADVLAARAIQLAGDGIPAEGAVYLLRRDPRTRGPELFKQHCAVCHTYGDRFENPRPTAPDLAGFGGKEWVLGLLGDSESPHYPFFGRTKLKTMTVWVQRTRDREAKKGKLPELEAEWDRIAEWLAGHPRAEPPKEGDGSTPFARGYQTFMGRCGSCHTYRTAEAEGEPTTKAPDFTGYGDAEWLRLMLAAPYHDQRYGRRNTMPAFRDLENVGAEINRLEVQEGKNLLLKEIKSDDPQLEEKTKAVDEATKVVSLSDIDRELIIRWLAGDDRLVFGGEPISAPPRSPRPTIKKD